MRGRLEELARRLPARPRAFLRRQYYRPRLRRLRRPLLWGTLRRRHPLFDGVGPGRGTTVEQFYVEMFVTQHESDLRGRVLAIGTDVLGERMGDAVTSFDVADVDPYNDAATILVDIEEPGCLPPAAFDCIVAAHALQNAKDPDAALANLWNSVAPGGVLLMSVAAIDAVDVRPGAGDAWRFLPSGLSTLIGAVCPGAQVEVSAAGNLVVAVAQLMGIAVEELRATEINSFDPAYPVIVLARVVRPPRL